MSRFGKIKATRRILGYVKERERKIEDRGVHELAGEGGESESMGG